MITMKKKVFLMALVGAALTACSNHDFDVMTPSEQVEANYEKAFIQTFGQPDPNQDWGFGSRVLPSSFGKKTRSYLGANTEGNNWESFGYTIPSPITDDELTAVLNVFNQKGAESYTSLIDWDCYFVQQVYKGTAKYISEAGGDPFVGSDKMNHLFTVTNMVRKSWWPEKFEKEGDDYNAHINNFNKGDNTDWNGIMLMENVESRIFGFDGTEDAKVIYNFRMEEINGNYYVGFDFEASGTSGTNMEVKRDYIYNDWIVKIVPGKGTSTTPKPVPEPTRYSVRIICEDLSASTGTDFDFNDVVFDASYTEGSNITTVTIQAAGGTLPLYVAGKEVHQLFAEAYPDKGITTKTMINTNASNGISGLAPITFTIDRIVAPWDIEVSVSKVDNLVQLKAEVGTPAAKIAVNPDFVWCDEREDIQTKYPNFSSYVQNTNVDWY